MVKDFKPLFIKDKRKKVLKFKNHTQMLQV